MQTSSQPESLAQAPYPSQLETLKQSHAEGENLHEKNEHGESVLHLAAARGDIPAVECLLSLNDPEFGLESTTASGETPFLLAVKNAHLETALFLKEQGANVLAEDHRKSNALHLALIHRSVDVWQERVKTAGLDLSRDQWASVLDLKLLDH